MYYLVREYLWKMVNNVLHQWTKSLHILKMYSQLTVLLMDIIRSKKISKLVLLSNTLTVVYI